MRTKMRSFFGCRYFGQQLVEFEASQSTTKSVTPYFSNAILAGPGRRTGAMKWQIASGKRFFTSSISPSEAVSKWRMPAAQTWSSACGLGLAFTA